MELYLYKNTKLLDEKNFQLDTINGQGISSSAIASYLSSFAGTDKKEFSSCQYEKDTGLYAEVKIALSQDYLDLNSGNWNYCDITNGSGHRYYFVKDMVWTAKNTIKLILKLDVLNTFKGKYDLDKQTLVKRQHKDRIAQLTTRHRTEIIDFDNFGLLITPEPGYNYSYEYDYIIGDTLPANISELDVDLTGILPPTVHATFTKTTYASTNTKLTIKLSFMMNPVNKVDTVILTYISSRGYFYRLIDKTPEGLNPVLYNNINEKQSIQDSRVKTDEFRNLKWYLINYSDTTLVKKLLCANRRLEVSLSASTLTINANDLTSSTYYYIDFANTSIDNPHGDGTSSHNEVSVWADSKKLIETKNNGQTRQVNSAVTINSYVASLVYYYKENNKITIKEMVYWKPQYDNLYGGWQYLETNTIAKGLTTIDLKSINNFVIYQGALAKSRKIIRGYGSTPKTVSVQSVEVLAMNEVDRTDDKIINFIELPYCPVSITSSFQFPGSVSLETDLGLLDITGCDLKTTFNAYDFHPLTDIAITNVIVDTTAARYATDLYESKMFNSEFCSYKLLYDNFAKDIKLEHLEPGDDYSIASNWPIEYDVSNELGTSILFTFNGFNNEISDVDYDNILFTNRNNQLALYHSDYLYYIRNGYNYDVKNNQLSIIKSGIDIATNTVAGAKVGGIGGAIVGAARGTYGLITNMVSAQNAMDQKLNSLENQAINVRNNNDVDIFNAYSDGNRLQFRFYEPLDAIKTQIKDLFYYCGYRCDYQGSPNATSRYWFNFIQCEPVFKDITAFMNKDVQAELINKYQQGVTVLHKNNNDFDFEQVKENWERSLLQ